MLLNKQSKVTGQFQTQDTKCSIIEENIQKLKQINKKKYRQIKKNKLIFCKNLKEYKL